MGPEVSVVNSPFKGGVDNDYLQGRSSYLHQFANLGE